MTEPIATHPEATPQDQPRARAQDQARPQAPFQPAPPPYRRLVRTDGPLAGVCGGLGAYLGVDPTVVRVLAVIAMVLTLPVGPLVYLVLWGVVPRA